MHEKILIPHDRIFAIPTSIFIVSVHYIISKCLDVNCNPNPCCWRLIQVNGLHHSHEEEELTKKNRVTSVYMKHLSKRCRSLFCIHLFQLN